MNTATIPTINNAKFINNAGPEYERMFAKACLGNWLKIFVSEAKFAPKFTRRPLTPYIMPRTN